MEQWWGLNSGDSQVHALLCCRLRHIHQSQGHAGGLRVGGAHPLSVAGLWNLSHHGCVVTSFASCTGVVFVFGCCFVFVVCVCERVGCACKCTNKHKHTRDQLVAYWFNAALVTT